MDVVDVKVGKFNTADDMEEQTIKAARGLGRETIKSWVKQHHTSKQSRD